MAAIMEFNVVQAGIDSFLRPFLFPAHQQQAVISLCQSRNVASKISSSASATLIAYFNHSVTGGR